MTLKELITKIVEDGKKSLKEHETGDCLKGGLEGFDICSTLNTAEDFIKVLEERYAEEAKLKMSEDLSAADYWRYRYATVQVEYAFEIVKVALGMSPVSARAAIKYAGYVGVTKD